MNRRILVVILLALSGAAVVGYLSFRHRPAETLTAADGISRPMKQAVVALFSVKPGDPPPALPAVPEQDLHNLPRLIESLTPADGCDPQVVQREFNLYMESGGFHLAFLDAYRKKLERLRIRSEAATFGSSKGRSPCPP